MKKIVPHRVGEIPLMESIVKKMNLRAILNEFLPRKNNEEMAPADILILLIYNLAIEKAPLYELEGWLSSIDLRCLELTPTLKNARITDDRFGKVLDRLFEVERATLMTRIIIEAIETFNIDLHRLHNDSTTVKAFGDYPGKTATGLELLEGNSKDQRHDLKQLVYTLTISSDGAVPIHFKTYPGNTNDDSTHIETWEMLRKIAQSADFLYVADCKLCSDKQLSHISENGGKALCPIPETWSEVDAFKEELRKANKPKKEIWRRERQDSNVTDYFSVYEGEYFTTKRGYRIHWIHYSERQKDDFKTREDNLKKAENLLNELVPKLNKRKWKSEEIILDGCKRILKQYKVERFIDIKIEHKIERKKICKNRRGRPQKGVDYEMIEKKIFNLSWNRNKKALTAEKSVDGVYPLLSTDRNLSAKEAIMAYKYQPKLEKRFMQLKSIHNIAPLLCKKLERVEANMFVFFVALLIQALIEREIRLKMVEERIPSLQIYPENRDAMHPTTSKVFDFFSRVCTYDLVEDDEIIEQYADELTEVQKSILNLLSIKEVEYWGRILARTG